MKLSEKEFKETFIPPMKRISQDAGPPFEFWSYVEAIPSADFEGHDCSVGAVTYVWDSSDGAFQHVLINSENKNIFMAVVLNIDTKQVAGHRLLNLEREYGIA